MNWIRIGLTDEQIDYFIRHYVDQMIETEKILNTQRLIAEKEKEKEAADVVREMWSGGKEIEHVEEETKPSELKSDKAKEKSMTLLEKRGLFDLPMPYTPEIRVPKRLAKKISKNRKRSKRRV